MKKKKPSSLTKRDMSYLVTMKTILEDWDETISQAFWRQEDLNDEELLIPSQIALQAFCDDNPKLNADDFAVWYKGLIEDEELFRLDRITCEVIKQLHLLFDSKTKEWIAEGLLDPDYDTSFAFWGIIGLAIHEISSKLGECIYPLRDDTFLKDPIFGKYKIIALEYADNCTLNDFQNPRSYNRYNKEACFIEAMQEYDGYEDYKRTLDVYDEVKNVVYRDPNRLLGETKKELEQLAKSSKQKKTQYAFLYACAVIDYWLKRNE